MWRSHVFGRIISHAVSFACNGAQPQCTPDLLSEAVIGHINDVTLAICPQLIQGVVDVQRLSSQQLHRPLFVSSPSPDLTPLYLSLHHDIFPAQCQYVAPFRRQPETIPHGHAKTPQCRGTPSARRSHPTPPIPHPLRDRTQGRLPPHEVARIRW